MTKSLIGQNPMNIIDEVIEAITFPCFMAVDFAGFVQTTNDEQVIKFIWPSWNTGIKQPNNQNWFLLETTKGKSDVRKHFKSMDLSLLQETWFESHDEISRLSESGFKIRRMVSIIFYVEPATPFIKELVQKSF